MKIVNSKVHGVIDYAAVCLLWILPLTISRNEAVCLLSIILGCIHLVLTIFTKFPLGLKGIIPFKTHSHIELAVSIILVSTPVFIGSLIPIESPVDRYYFGGFGLVVFGVWLVTDYTISVERAETGNP